MTALSPAEEKDISLDDLFLRLSTTRKGLTSVDAAERTARFGPNEIVEKKRSRVVAFLLYFWGPIPWMIEAAIVISAIIQHWEDLAIIFSLLAVNAVVGFWQENKAGNAVELLKQRLALKARVLRDGRWIEISASGLVPGDVVHLRLGNIVPADCRLFAGDYLVVDESALTGESLPVEKHVPDIAYSSSIVRQGEMDAVVASTGMSTFFGRTTELVQKAETKSHFQKAVVRIGDYLIALAAFLVALTILAGLLRHQGILELLQFGLVLTVAAIPVAMPAVLSVSMAVGAESLAKKEAIVSRLVAIEEMAGVDILCADKTGTITKNELSVGEVAPMPGYSRDDVLLYASLASREEDGDPIDDAVLSRARISGEVSGEVQKSSVKSFRPFDPVSKRTEAEVNTSDGRVFHVSKGAPQVILDISGDRSLVETQVTDGVNAAAAKGFRTLGVAVAEELPDWRYVGLIELYDPPREDSAETIATAQSMGLEVKMVTGDHIAIAKEVSGLVGLKGSMATASAFLDRPDVEAGEVIEGAAGFAEVFPEHKYRIVEMLQDRGHIVCMTGDGVNDAPALKKADAGIAVAGATDAAKSAAAVVLTRPGLSVIIDAIKSSRMIFQRMTNYAIYTV